MWFVTSAKSAPTAHRTLSVSTDATEANLAHLCPWRSALAATLGQASEQTYAQVGMQLARATERHSVTRRHTNGRAVARPARDGDRKQRYEVWETETGVCLYLSGRCTEADGQKAGHARHTANSSTYLTCERAQLIARLTSSSVVRRNRGIAGIGHTGTTMHIVVRMDVPKLVRASDEDTYSRYQAPKYLMPRASNAFATNQPSPSALACLVHAREDRVGDL